MIILFNINFDVTSVVDCALEQYGGLCIGVDHLGWRDFFVHFGGNFILLTQA